MLVYSYSDKLAVFLKAVVKELVQPSYLNQFHFQVEVNRLKVSLSSFSNEQSYQHALYFHDLLTQKEKVDNIAVRRPGQGGGGCTPHRGGRITSVHIHVCALISSLRTWTL